MTEGVLRLAIQLFYCERSYFLNIVLDINIEKFYNELFDFVNHAFICLEGRCSDYGMDIWLISFACRGQDRWSENTAP
jgi:hypothetical protein